MTQNNFAKTKKTNTSMLAMMALMVTLILLLAYTPLGTIFIGPISINLAGLPVIIGAILLGLKPGVTLGAIWGAVQFSKVFFVPSPMLAPLFFSPAHWYDPILFVLLMLIPRMLVPVVAWAVAKMPLSNRIVKFGIASVAGSFTNTVVFLGLLYLLFMNSLAANYGTKTGAIASMLFGIASTNGVVEAIFAAVCSPIIVALQKAVKGLPGSQKESSKDAKKAAEANVVADEAATAGVAQVADAADKTDVAQVADAADKAGVAQVADAAVESTEAVETVAEKVPQAPADPQKETIE